MNIALTFPGCHRRGGVERIVYECASYLAGRDHQVTVFAAECEPLNSANLTHRQVNSRRKPRFISGPSFFRKCTRALQRESFDVVNSHGCVCPLGGVHWVQSVHKAWLETCRKFRSPWSLGRMRQRLNPLHPLLLRLEERHFRERNFKTLIATTPRVKADLAHYYGVAPDDVQIVPNGFNPRDFNPLRRQTLRDGERRNLGLSEHHVALLFVANELQRKGYQSILKAMQVLGNKDLRLVVVGRPDVREVMRVAADHGLDKQVIAAGATPDVGRFHAAADVFVLPTQYEAFCLAILEALGSGLPVVTSNVPGASDAIQSGVNGFVVGDPTDGEELAAALAPLLDASLRTQLSHQAPATVAQYQWPVVLRRYEEILRAYAA